jgi:hypothetical protein
MVSVPIIAFAYPGGDFNNELRAEVEMAGYLMGFTTVPGTNVFPCDRMALRRTEISASDSRFVFKMKLRGALDWLWFKDAKWMRGLLRRTNRLLMLLAR